MAKSNPKNAPAAHLVEMDDLNLDSSWLTESRVKSQQLRVGTDAGAPIEHLIYGSGLESFVLDIGGNETASKTLNAVGEQMLFRHFNLIVIPVRDEGQDVDNAVKTINLIREHDRNVKISILLNDISSRSQDLADHALRESFAEVFELAEQAACEMMVMPRIERYGRSRRLGMTQWEINEDREAIADDLKTRVLAAEASGDQAQAKLLTRLIRAVSGSRQIREMIDVVHTRLDQILGTRHQRLRVMVVSTKGGVGKSVCSQQLIATYLLSRLGVSHE